MAEFERSILIQNKQSSHFRDARRRAHIESQVAAIGLPVEHIDVINSEQVLEELSRKNVSQESLLLIGGGDGTVSHHGRLALSEAGLELGLNKVVTLPLLAGNACDIAHMLNNAHDPSYVVQNGHQVDLHPLDFTVDGELQERAFAYLSFHASALANDALERVKHQSTPWQRRTRIQLGREVLAAWRAMGSAYPIQFQEEGKDWRPVTEVAFFNGDRVARLGHPHANLLEDGFEQMTVNVKGMGVALVNMLKLQHGRLPGEMVTEANFTLRTPGDEPIRYQIEGEGGEVSSGARISVSTSELSLRSLSTRNTPKQGVTLPKK